VMRAESEKQPNTAHVPSRAVTRTAGFRSMA
jgi:hypothetical protein